MKNNTICMELHAKSVSHISGIFCTPENEQVDSYRQLSNTNAHAPHKNSLHFDNYLQHAFIIVHDKRLDFDPLSTEMAATRTFAHLQDF